MYMGVKTPWLPASSSAHAARSSIWCVAQVPFGASHSFSSTYVKISVSHAALRAVRIAACRNHSRDHKQPPRQHMKDYRFVSFHSPDDNKGNDLTAGGRAHPSTVRARRPSPRLYAPGARVHVHREGAPASAPLTSAAPLTSLRHKGRGAERSSGGANSADPRPDDVIIHRTSHFT
eukprot:6200849-Pyramimonas_sp.AAC.1